MPDLRAPSRAAVGPVLGVSLPSHPAHSPRPLPVQDVLPGRGLLTAAPVDPHLVAPGTSRPPSPALASAAAGEASDQPVAEFAAPGAVPAVELVAPAAAPLPARPDGTGHRHRAPVDDLSTSLALLLATGLETPPSAVPAEAPAVAVVAHPAPGPVPRAEPVAGAPAVAAAQGVGDPVVPAQVRRRVELGFRDGSSTALDPDSEQALALAELSSLLTGRH